MALIVERVASDLKKAMLNRDTESVDILKMLKTAFQYEALNQRIDSLDDEQALKVLRKEFKKRTDAEKLYRDNDQPAKAEKEKSEADFLGRYLPMMMSEQDVQNLVISSIQDLGVDSIKDMGRIIAEVKQRSEGNADGATIANLVKQELNPKQ